MKKILLYAFAFMTGALLLSACSDESVTPKGNGSNAKKATVMTTPTLACSSATRSSITLTVCTPLGGSGAPAGFSVQWMTATDYATYGWSGGAPSYCGASFSGNAFNSRYNLVAGACVDITLGGDLFDDAGASSSCYTDLECGANYVFRTFAHANSSLNRSVFSGNTSCSTLSCSDNCTYTQGYWKTHGPQGCVTGNNTNEWPALSECTKSIQTGTDVDNNPIFTDFGGMKLGNTCYIDTELCTILNTPAKGNMFYVLAHQLIAAKLNVAAGASSSILATINAADAAIANNDYSNASALTAALDFYNTGGTGGENHCD